MKISFHNLLFLYILTLCQGNAQELPLFKNGDNVVLIGDSITHGGSYHTFIQIFHATQFPNQEINYYNCGVAGDNAEGTIYRLEKDILIHQPDHAIIMLGMNDVGRWTYPVDRKANEKELKQRVKILQTYVQNMEKLCSSLINKGVSIILMTPSIYDQTAEIKKENRFGINDGLIQFGEAIKKLGKKYSAPVVDLNAAMLKVNKKVQSNNIKNTIVGHDRVHPGDLGHLIMAYEIINTLFPVIYISDIKIDAKTNKVLKQTNCTVVLKNDETEFALLQQALPFPVKKSLYPTLKLIDYPSAIPKEMISIKNLDKGMYKLLIDTILVGSYSNQELSEGIDLSKNQKTPQYQQAEKVSELCFQYRKTNDFLRTIAATEFRTLRDFKGPNIIEAKKSFLQAKNEKSKGKSWYYYEKKKAKEYFEILPKQDSLWRALKDIRDKIYVINQPIKHSYKLIKTE